MKTSTIAEDLMYSDVLKEMEKLATTTLPEKSPILGDKLDPASSSTTIPEVDLKMDPGPANGFKLQDDVVKTRFVLTKSDFLAKTTPKTSNDSTTTDNEFFKDSSTFEPNILPMKIKGAKKPQKGQKYNENPIFVSENQPKIDMTVLPENLTLKRTNKTTVVSPSAFKLKATVTTKIPDPPGASNLQEFVKTEEKLGDLGNSVKFEDLTKKNAEIDVKTGIFAKQEDHQEFGNANSPLEHQDIQLNEQRNGIKEDFPVKPQEIHSKSYNLISELPKNHDFSSRTHLAVTIAEECLDDFDPSLTRSCMYEKQWKNRYYFDKDARSCRMFWWDGCFSSSRNSFSDEETCKWKCLGAHPKPEGSTCLESFDTTYLGDCRNGKFENRFYFDLNTKQCISFHWGGCRSDSRNFFADFSECQRVCENPPRELVQSCLEPFDNGYEKSCLSDGRYHQYYFYDINTHSCKMFWFGNCRRTNQNIFPSLSTCQWVCERDAHEKKQDACLDEFDPKYEDSCGQGIWMEKWRFDHSTGRCKSFWFDQCVSKSQNIFPDEASCKSQCEKPGLNQLSRFNDTESNFRCLEPKTIGECKETYPAYHYDRQLRECRPFSYSGCGGNGNRFLTINQCEMMCFDFNSLTDPEMDCFEPLDIGYGRNEMECIENSGFRFYFDRDFGSCSKFWYLGCGGNANNFYSFDVCHRTCRNSRRLPKREIDDISVCFDVPSDKGRCHNNDTKPVQRWTYTNGKCANFTYSGCDGSSNRFSSLHECESICKGLKKSIQINKCSHQPDWGTCNHMRYMWYYESKVGTCAQFLYGGCGGNTNRFETFEECQKDCEPSGFDPCLEHLDRGRWCEDMSNRYYYNKKMKECKGFHYTGCGNSNNNFHTLEECEARCVRRARKGKALPIGEEIRENRLEDENLMNSEEENGIFDKLATVDVKENALKLNLSWAPESTQKTTRKTVTPTPKPVRSSTRKSTTKSLDKYAHRKPTEKTPMLRHEFLNGVNRTYLKTDPEWHHYETCLGYRYNVSGHQTVLKTHLCDMDGNRHCWSEIHESTNSEEHCAVIRPFLRGVHLYSWFFELTMKPHDYSPTSKNRKEQKKDETLASLLLLKANRCFDIC
ncbi:unnamed protein product, partial [Mesorhabditis belari]|uniref:BPTI/Kunitz inhibitor domain-containing protein n=1 Tax=Mesorhabditis belari TaxID=2138241 RepID=A0AAF3F4U1_9BILA